MIKKEEYGIGVPSIDQILKLDDLLSNYNYYAFIKHITVLIFFLGLIGIGVLYGLFTFMSSYSHSVRNTFCVIVAIIHIAVSLRIFVASSRAMYMSCEQMSTILFTNPERRHTPFVITIAKEVVEKLKNMQACDAVTSMYLFWKKLNGSDNNNHYYEITVNTTVELVKSLNAIHAFPAIPQLVCLSCYKLNTSLTLLFYQRSLHYLL